MRICSVEDCGGKYFAIGYCRKHYSVNYRARNPERCAEYRQKSWKKHKQQRREYRQKNRERINRVALEYYYKNIEKRREWGRLYYQKTKHKRNRSECQRVRKRIVEYKDDAGGECMFCGYDKNYAGLLFHHISGEKKFRISIGASRPKVVVLAEIKKCILLCHNCHQDLHYPHLRKETILEQKNKE